MPQAARSKMLLANGGDSRGNLSRAPRVSPSTHRWLRRRPQFGLKSLLFSTLLFAVFFAYVRGLIMLGRRQVAVAAALEARFASVKLGPREDWPAAWILPRADNLVLTRVDWKTGVWITDADLGLLAEARWLRRCRLRACGLRDEKLEFLSSMPSLESLDLSDNAVTDAGIVLAATSTCLKRLHLSGTLVEGPFLRSLRCRKGLSGLDLSNTAATGDHLVAVRTFPALENLFLDGLRRADECAGSISEVRLHRLLLNDSDLSDAGLKELARCQELGELCIDRTAVTSRGIENVRSLRALNHLSLRGLPLSRGAIEAIATLPELIYLHLSECTFNESDLDALCQSPSVSSVTLSDTNLSDTGLQRLIDIPSLEFVHVIGTRVTARAVEEFEAQRPDCIVPFDESKRRK